MAKQRDIIGTIVDTKLSEVSIDVGGESAYDIAVRLGYGGTEEQWIVSLQGQDGQPGTKGEPGLTGESGVDGVTPLKDIDYFDGAKGDTGDDFVYSDFTPEQLLGLKGETGETGLQGLKGDTGDRGLKGEDGATGAAGSDASVTKINVEAVLTGEISTHTHAGGSGGLTQPQILTRQL